jgi:hypothetical protein
MSMEDKENRYRTARLRSRMLGNCAVLESVLSPSFPYLDDREVLVGI